MTPNLLQHLCEPITKATLVLIEVEHVSDGNIISGALVDDMQPMVNSIKFLLNRRPRKTLEYATPQEEFLRNHLE